MNDASHGAGILPEQGASKQRGSRIRARKQPPYGTKIVRAQSPLATHVASQLESRSSSAILEEAAEEAEFTMADARRRSRPKTGSEDRTGPSEVLADVAPHSINQLHDHTDTFASVVHAFLEQARASNQEFLASISPRPGNECVTLDDHTATFEHVIKRHRASLGLPPKR